VIVLGLDTLPLTPSNLEGEWITTAKDEWMSKRDSPSKIEGVRGSMKKRGVNV
jgi:hypothetical protein